MLHIIHSILSHIAGFFGTAFVLMLIAAFVILVCEMIRYHRRRVNITVESSAEPGPPVCVSAVAPLESHETEDEEEHK